MTQVHKLQNSEKKNRKAMEPMAEGIQRKPNSFYAKMSDVELVGFAKRLVEARGIRGRKELEKAYRGLYEGLRRRKLIDEIGLEEKLRDWASMNDEELVGFAKRFIDEKKITGRKELEKADKGLYRALRNRGLIERIGLENSNVEHRKWALMEDGELVGFAKRFIEDKKITGRKELEKADLGLYNVLRRRKLVEVVRLENSNIEHRTWTSMTDGELVEVARKFIDERGITGRSELEKADRGLYQALRKRKLIDAVFAPLEQKKRDEMIGQLADAVDVYIGIPGK
jgi:hypothetical protein